jgi:hypothetical protein
MADAGTAICSELPLEYVVVSALPLIPTAEAEMKPVPLMLRGCAGDPATMLAGVNDVMAGVGLLVELPPEPVEEDEEEEVEPPPPQPERINKEPKQEAKTKTTRRRRNTNPPKISTFRKAQTQLAVTSGGLFFRPFTFS